MSLLRWCRVMVFPVALLLSVATHAGASVDVIVSFGALVNASSDVAVVTAMDQTAVWEEGRIYTYSHLHVDDAVAGALNNGDDVWVRTMGGVVGKIGQSVEGESVFITGESSLVFLRHAPAGTYDVAGRAQGQFPIVVSATGVRTVIRSGATAGLVPRRAAPDAIPVHTEELDTAARDRLHGMGISDMHQAVRSAWALLHTGN